MITGEAADRKVFVAIQLCIKIALEHFFPVHTGRPRTLFYIWYLYVLARINS